MANINSHAFDLAVEAGMALYASKRLNQMTNDNAMKALASEILTAYLGIAIDPSLNAALGYAQSARATIFCGEITDRQELLLADLFAKAMLSVVADHATCKNSLQVPFPAPATKATVEDFAARLFSLHGFMLLHSAGSKGRPTITISFPDLKEARQFHDVLVELSQHRAAPEGK